MTMHHDRTVAPQRGRGETFQRKLVIGIAAALVVVVAWLIVSATVPRWWAQRMGNVIDGRLTFGTFVGVVVGALFTVVPLVVLWLGWRVRGGWRDGAWKRFAVFVVLALALATPNLATLGIVFGSGNAAEAGEQTLNVTGPGFRGGSLVGALVGVALIVAVLWLASSRRRNKRKAGEYRRELQDRPRETRPSATDADRQPG